MKTLVRTVCLEFLKINNTFMYWLILLGASFMPIFVSFVFLNKWRYIAHNLLLNPWDNFAEMTWKGMGFLYTPFFIVLLTCLFLNIEHASNTWKQLFTMPVSKSTTYFGKLLTIILLNAIFYVLFIAVWIGSGYLTGFLRPELGLASNSPNYALLFGNCFHSFISSLGLISIHFLLSLRFKNMVIPIAICVVGCLIWVAMYQGKAVGISYLPYAYHYSTVNPPSWINVNNYWIFPQHEIYSIFYFIAFTSLGHLYFTTRFIA